ncbi:DUF6895 family protein, partial [Streptomyces otsuchiensis]|uniref:DUF6895 family protein n=1 Tax=Streptomyces otsuchiensis TaxID=2681388 RepID=UPI003F68A59D
MTDASGIGVMHEVGDRAIAWLHQHQNGFRPRHDDSTTDWEVKDRLKPIGELALIGKVLFREGVAGSRQSALTRQLLDNAWRDLLDGGRLLTWMQQQEPLSPIPFEIYVPFRELGYEETSFEATARTVHALDSWSAMEAQPAHRQGLHRRPAVQRVHGPCGGLEGRFLV